MPPSRLKRNATKLTYKSSMAETPRGEHPSKIYMTRVRIRPLMLYVADRPLILRASVVDPWISGLSADASVSLAAQPLMS